MPRRGTGARMRTSPVLMRWLAAAAVLAAWWPAPGAAASLTARDIVARALRVDDANFRRARDYTYTEAQVSRTLDGHGNVRSTASKKFDVIYLAGEPYEELLEKDGKPVSDPERRDIQAKMDRKIARYEHESSEQRASRTAKNEKRREEAREFVLDIMNAYDFTLLRETVVDGRPAYEIRGEPRPDFHPAHRNAEILAKIRPRFWIGKRELAWLRIDGEVIAPVTWGGLVLRLSPGSHFEFEQTKVNDETWMLSHVNVKIGARVALIKSVNGDLDISYGDFKKFSADSRIVATGAAVRAPSP